MNSDIKQFTHVVDVKTKREFFLDLLRYTILKSETARKMIVFCRTKRGVDNLENYLGNARNRKDKEGKIMFDARGIHGDKLQYERDKIY